MRDTNYTVDVTWIDWVALTLVVVGALNWGLVGLGGLMDQNWNLVHMLLGWAPTVENLVYVLVGLAGVYVLYFAWQLHAVETNLDAERTDSST